MAELLEAGADMEVQEKKGTRENQSIRRQTELLLKLLSTQNSQCYQKSPHGMHFKNLHTTQVALPFLKPPSWELNTWVGNQEANKTLINSHISIHINTQCYCLLASPFRCTSLEPHKNNVITIHYLCALTYIIYHNIVYYVISIYHNKCKFLICWIYLYTYACTDALVQHSAYMFCI